jgi:hypothetical protein
VGLGELDEEFILKEVFGFMEVSLKDYKSKLALSL